MTAGFGTAPALAFPVAGGAAAPQPARHPTHREEIRTMSFVTAQDMPKTIRIRAGAYGLLVLLAALSTGPVLAHEGHRHAPPPAAAPAGETAFVAENEAAMTRMMDTMAVRPMGDIDRDFVAMMAPHHGGAIDMATIYLRYGHNEQLRRLAQEIIVTQQQEIAAMQLALGEAPPPSTPAPTGATPASAR